MKTDLSQGPRPALRTHDAGDLRRAFQLLVPGARSGRPTRRLRAVARHAAQPFISERYFDLLRNYRRHGWLVLYLFGVSPVVCKSFLRGRNVTLPRLSQDTSYEPYATSLRMSDLGYRNRNQAGLVGVGQQPR